MKTLITAIIFACVLTLFLIQFNYAQTDTLTIIHVNDSHSNLLPYPMVTGDYGGIARAASVIGQWRMTVPNPILLHGGDFMVGTFMFNMYFGVPELQILQSLGFDALVLGNHEFDPGPVDLGNILATAQLDSSFDIISSNALGMSQVPTLDSIVRPYAIERRGNVKVGIFGMTTPSTVVISNPSPVVFDTTTTGIVTAALTAVAQLQAQGCQIIVMLSHMGFEADKALAPHLSGVDVIIGGHSHDALSNIEFVNGIAIVQAGEFYHYVGKLTLVYDGNTVSAADYTLQEITPLIPPEPSIDAIVQQLKLGIIAQYSPVIGNPYQPISYAPELLHNYPQISSPMNLQEPLDTPVGNLFTMAMLDHVPAGDCALEPNGHIVEEIYPGPVTAADLLRVYPYGLEEDGLGFRLASFDLSGMEIFAILQGLMFQINPLTSDFEYLPQSTGLDFNAYYTSAGIQLTAVTIQNQPLDPIATYRIVSSDRTVGYIQELFSFTPRNIVYDSLSVIQIVKEYVEQFDTLNFLSSGHNLLPIEAGNPGDQLISQIELLPNYPNPFNPETTIPIRLPSRSEAELLVYNCLGQKIYALHEGILPAGYHEFHWQSVDDRGCQVGSGIYFVVLKTTQQQYTRKLILMR
ncbi:MAG: 5'-nucleotidase C-terminal domain-containing protein [bacterium]|nr:MAG: 5'-nucleotidase C-terminal domain-containing protein [bacterium]